VECRTLRRKRERRREASGRAANLLVEPSATPEEAAIERDLRPRPRRWRARCGR
jgi:hypothetical protein